MRAMAGDVTGENWGSYMAVALGAEVTLTTKASGEEMRVMLAPLG